MMRDSRRRSPESSRRRRTRDRRDSRDQLATATALSTMPGPSQQQYYQQHQQHQPQQQPLPLVYSQSQYPQSYAPLQRYPEPERYAARPERYDDPQRYSHPQPPPPQQQPYPPHPEQYPPTEVFVNPLGYTQQQPYVEPQTYHQEPREPETMRPRGASSSSSSSSTSSSLLNISAKSPRFGGVFSTFFRAPSEQRNRRRRKKQKARILSFGNSSSSSVNSDMAYGRGYIDRDKSQPPSPMPQGHPSPALHRASPADASYRPPLAPRDKTDEEILNIGRQLQDIARKQTQADFKAASKSRASQVAGAAAAAAAFSHFGSKSKSDSKTRASGTSKPDQSASSSDDDWESASEDETTTDESDNGLAYGSVFKPAKSARISSEPPEQIRPPERRSTIVDPRLFGPVNSLRGAVKSPCGFGEQDPRSAGSSRRHHEETIAQVESPKAGKQAMQRIYPVPTSDPDRFDYDRGSVTSSRRDLQQRARPEPVPIQQPIPIVPVSSKVYDAERFEEDDRAKQRRSPSKERSTAGKAIAGVGVAAAAIGAAMTHSPRDSGAHDDRRDDRQSEAPKRREDPRDFQQGRRKNEPEQLIRVELEDRETRKQVDTRRSSRRNDADVVDERDKKRVGRSDPAYEALKRPAAERDPRPEVYKLPQGDEIRVEYDPNDNRPPREEPKELRREERKTVVVDEPRETRRPEKPTEWPRDKNGVEQPEAPSTQTPIDPFQFQVADDAFQTPKYATPKRPLTPQVVTVDREPSFDNSPPRKPDYSESRMSRKDSFELEQRLEQYQRGVQDRSRTPGPRRRGGSIEEEERAAKSIYDEAKRATAPIAAAAIAAAVAVEAERSRKHRRDQATEDGSRDKSQAAKDVVQEEADRYYRETVIARKIAKEEMRSRSASPHDESVVGKWQEHDDGPEVVTIVTPPEMEHHHHDKSPYDAPNADVRIDHIMIPEELSRFSLPGRQLAADEAPKFLARDPSCERERPLLNLVLPTPIVTPRHTPAPERQNEPSSSSSKEEAPEPVSVGPADASSSDAVPATEIVSGPRGEATQRPTTPTAKSVTWGVNETKSFDIESPEPPKETASSSSSKSKKKKKLGKSSPWGIISAAAVAPDLRDPFDSKPDEHREKHSPPESPRSRGIEPIAEPTVLPASYKDSKPFEDEHDLPPAPGPKPSSPQTTRMPGAFADDIEFASVLAAGLQDTGFDPNIVIDNPTYMHRDSPPGQSEPMVYQQPFAETVTDLGIYGPESTGPADSGFVIGEVPETPVAERDLENNHAIESPRTRERRDKEKAKEPPRMEQEPPVEDVESSRTLSKKEKRKQKAAKRQSVDNTPANETYDAPVASSRSAPILSSETTRDQERPHSYYDVPRATPQDVPASLHDSGPVYERPHTYYGYGAPRPTPLSGSNPYPNAISAHDRPHSYYGVPEMTLRNEPAPLDEADPRSEKPRAFDENPRSPETVVALGPKDRGFQNVPTWDLPATSDVPRPYGETLASAASVSETAPADSEPVSPSKPSKKEKKKKKKSTSSKSEIIVVQEDEEEPPIERPLRDEPRAPRETPPVSERYHTSGPQETGEDAWKTLAKKKKSKKSKQSSDEWTDVEKQSDYTPTVERSSTRDDFDEWGDLPTKFRRDRSRFEDEDVSSVVSDPSSRREKSDRRLKGSRHEDQDASSVVSDPSSRRDKSERRSHSSRHDDRDVTSVVSESTPRSGKSERRSKSLRDEERDADHAVSDRSPRHDKSDRLSNGTRHEDSDDAKSVASGSSGRKRQSDDQKSPKEEEKRSSGFFNSLFRGSNNKEASGKDEKSSFLDNAGTLGAGVGLAGAVAALSSIMSRSNATEPPHLEEPVDIPRSREMSASRTRDVDIDPEIVPRDIRPAIDPQYGDLLPLPPSPMPPSTPGSPTAELEVLPALPDSRPETPPEERRRQHETKTPKTHSRKRSNIETPARSPSQTAVPFKLRLGQRPTQSSPGNLAPSPVSSPPTATAPDVIQITTPTSATGGRRPSRPISWENSREIKPLYLLEQSRQESAAHSMEPPIDFPELPPSEPPSRESPAPEFSLREDDVNYFNQLQESPFQPDDLRIDTEMSQYPDQASRQFGSRETTPKVEHAVQQTGAMFERVPPALPESPDAAKCLDLSDHYFEELPPLPASPLDTPVMGPVFERASPTLPESPDTAKYLELSEHYFEELPPLPASPLDTPVVGPVFEHASPALPELPDAAEYLDLSDHRLEELPPLPVSPLDTPVMRPEELPPLPASPLDTPVMKPEELPPLPISPLDTPIMGPVYERVSPALPKSPEAAEYLDLSELCLEELPPLPVSPLDTPSMRPEELPSLPISPLDTPIMGPVYERASPALPKSPEAAEYLDLSEYSLEELPPLPVSPLDTPSMRPEELPPLPASPLVTPVIEPKAEPTDATSQERILYRPASPALPATTDAAQQAAFAHTTLADLPPLPASPLVAPVMEPEAEPTDTTSQERILYGPASPALPATTDAAKQAAFAHTTLADLPPLPASPMSGAAESLQQSVIPTSKLEELPAFPDSPSARPTMIPEPEPVETTSKERNTPPSPTPNRSYDATVGTSLIEEQNLAGSHDTALVAFAGGAVAGLAAASLIDHAEAKDKATEVEREAEALETSASTEPPADGKKSKKDKKKNKKKAKGMSVDNTALPSADIASSGSTDNDNSPFTNVAPATTAEDSTSISNEATRSVPIAEQATSLPLSEHVAIISVGHDESPSVDAVPAASTSTNDAILPSTDVTMAPSIEAMPTANDALPPLPPVSAEETVFLSNEADLSASAGEDTPPSIQDNQPLEPAENAPQELAVHPVLPADISLPAEGDVAFDGEVTGPAAAELLAEDTPGEKKLSKEKKKLQKIKKAWEQAQAEMQELEHSVGPSEQTKDAVLDTDAPISSSSESAKATETNEAEEAAAIPLPNALDTAEEETLVEPDATKEMTQAKEAAATQLPDISEAALETPLLQSDEVPVTTEAEQAASVPLPEDSEPMMDSSLSSDTEKAKDVQESEQPEPAPEFKEPIAALEEANTTLPNVDSPKDAVEPGMPAVPPILDTLPSDAKKNKKKKKKGRKSMDDKSLVPNLVPEAPPAPSLSIGPALDKDETSLDVITNVQSEQQASTVESYNAEDDSFRQEPSLQPLEERTVDQIEVTTSEPCAPPLEVVEKSFGPSDDLGEQQDIVQGQSDKSVEQVVDSSELQPALPTQESSSKLNADSSERQTPTTQSDDAPATTDSQQEQPVSVPETSPPAVEPTDESREVEEPTKTASAPLSKKQKKKLKKSRKSLTGNDELSAALATKLPESQPEPAVDQVPSKSNLDVEPKEAGISEALPAESVADSMVEAAPVQPIVDATSEMAQVQADAALTPLPEDDTETLEEVSEKRPEPVLTEVASAIPLPEDTLMGPEETSEQVPTETVVPAMPISKDAAEKSTTATPKTSDNVPTVNPDEMPTPEPVPANVEAPLAEAARPESSSKKKKKKKKGKGGSLSQLDDVISAATTPLQSPGVQTPAAEVPVDESFGAEDPMAGNRAVGPSNAEPSANEVPTSENPSAETPAVETPSVEIPSVETPVDETPVDETPVVETPVEETPAIKASAVEVSADEPVPTGAEVLEAASTTETPAAKSTPSGSAFAETLTENPSADGSVKIKPTDVIPKETQQIEDATLQTSEAGLATDKTAPVTDMLETSNYSLVPDEQTATPIPAEGTSNSKSSKMSTKKKEEEDKKAAEAEAEATPEVAAVVADDVPGITLDITSHDLPADEKPVETDSTGAQELVVKVDEPQSGDVNVTDPAAEDTLSTRPQTPTMSESQDEAFVTPPQGAATPENQVETFENTSQEPTLVDSQIGSFEAKPQGPRADADQDRGLDSPVEPETPTISKKSRKKAKKEAAAAAAAAAAATVLEPSTEDAVKDSDDKEAKDETITDNGISNTIPDKLGEMEQSSQEPPTSGEFATDSKISEEADPGPTVTKKGKKKKKGKKSSTLDLEPSPSTSTLETTADVANTREQSAYMTSPSGEPGSDETRFSQADAPTEAELAASETASKKKRKSVTWASELESFSTNPEARLHGEGEDDRLGGDVSRAQTAAASETLFETKPQSGQDESVAGELPEAIGGGEVVASQGSEMDQIGTAEAEKDLGSEGQAQMRHAREPSDALPGLHNTSPNNPGDGFPSWPPTRGVAGEPIATQQTDSPWGSPRTRGDVEVANRESGETLSLEVDAEQEASAEADATIPEPAGRTDTIDEPWAGASAQTGEVDMGDPGLHTAAAGPLSGPIGDKSLGATQGERIADAQSVSPALTDSALEAGDPHDAPAMAVANQEDTNMEIPQPLDHVPSAVVDGKISDAGITDASADETLPLGDEQDDNNTSQVQNKEAAGHAEKDEKEGLHDSPAIDAAFAGLSDNPESLGEPITSEPQLEPLSETIPGPEPTGDPSTTTPQDPDQTETRASREDSSRPEPSSSSKMSKKDKKIKNKTKAASASAGPFPQDNVQNIKKQIVDDGAPPVQPVDEQVQAPEQAEPEPSQGVRDAFEVAPVTEAVEAGEDEWAIQPSGKKSKKDKKKRAAAEATAAAAAAAAAAQSDEPTLDTSKVADEMNAPSQPALDEASKIDVVSDEQTAPVDPTETPADAPNVQEPKENAETMCTAESTTAEVHAPAQPTTDIPDNSVTTDDKSGAPEEADPSGFEPAKKSKKDKKKKRKQSVSLGDRQEFTSPTVQAEKPESPEDTTTTAPAPPEGTFLPDTGNKPTEHVPSLIEAVLEDPQKTLDQNESTLKSDEAPATQAQDSTTIETTEAPAADNSEVTPELPSDLLKDSDSAPHTDLETLGDGTASTLQEEATAAEAAPTTEPPLVPSEVPVVEEQISTPTGEDTPALKKSKKDKKKTKKGASIDTPEDQLPAAEAETVAEPTTVAQTAETLQESSLPAIDETTQPKGASAEGPTPAPETTQPTEEKPTEAEPTVDKPISETPITEAEKPKTEVDPFAGLGKKAKKKKMAEMAAAEKAAADANAEVAEEEYADNRLVGAAVEDKTVEETPTELEPAEELLVDKKPAKKEHVEEVSTTRAPQTEEDPFAGLSKKEREKSTAEMVAVDAVSGPTSVETTQTAEGKPAETAIEDKSAEKKPSDVIIEDQGVEENAAEKSESGTPIVEVDPFAGLKKKQKKKKMAEMKAAAAAEAAATQTKEVVEEKTVDTQTDKASNQAPALEIDPPASVENASTDDSVPTPLKEAPQSTDITNPEDQFPIPEKKSKKKKKKGKASQSDPIVEPVVEQPVAQQSEQQPEPEVQAEVPPSAQTEVQSTSLETAHPGTVSSDEVAALESTPATEQLPAVEKAILDQDSRSPAVEAPATDVSSADQSAVAQSEDLPVESQTRSVGVESLSDVPAAPDINADDEFPLTDKKMEGMSLDLPEPEPSTGPAPEVTVSAVEPAAEPVTEVYLEPSDSAEATVQEPPSAMPHTPLEQSADQTVQSETVAQTNDDEFSAPKLSKDKEKKGKSADAVLVEPEELTQTTLNLEENLADDVVEAKEASVTEAETAFLPTETAPTDISAKAPSEVLAEAAPVEVTPETPVVAAIKAPDEVAAEAPNMDEFPSAQKVSKKDKEKKDRLQDDSDIVSGANIPAEILGPESRAKRSLDVSVEPAEAARDAEPSAVPSESEPTTCQDQPQAEDLPVEEILATTEAPAPLSDHYQEVGNQADPERQPPAEEEWPEATSAKKSRKDKKKNGKSKVDDDFALGSGTTTPMEATIEEAKDVTTTEETSTTDNKVTSYLPIVEPPTAAVAPEVLDTSANARTLTNELEPSSEHGPEIVLESTPDQQLQVETADGAVDNSSGTPFFDAQPIMDIREVDEASKAAEQEPAIEGLPADAPATPAQESPEVATAIKCKKDEKKKRQSLPLDDSEADFYLGSGTATLQAVPAEEETASKLKSDTSLAPVDEVAVQSTDGPFEQPAAEENVVTAEKSDGSLDSSEPVHTSELPDSFSKLDDATSSQRELDEPRVATEDAQTVEPASKQVIDDISASTDRASETIQSSPPTTAELLSDQSPAEPAVQNAQESTAMEEPEDAFVVEGSREDEKKRDSRAMFDRPATPILETTESSEPVPLVEQAVPEATSEETSQETRGIDATETSADIVKTAGDHATDKIDYSDNAPRDTTQSPTVPPTPEPTAVLESPAEFVTQGINATDVPRTPEKSVGVDLTPAQETSSVVHELPFDQSDKRKKMKTRELPNTLLPEPIVSSREIAAAYVDSGHAALAEEVRRAAEQRSLPTPEPDTPRDRGPAVHKMDEDASRHLEPNISSALDMAASYLELRNDRAMDEPMHPKTAEKQPDSESPGMGIAAGIATAAAGASVLSSKSGSAEKRGKKSKYEDKRAPQEEAMFDDSSLWEGTDRKQVIEAANADAGDFGGGGETVGHEQITRKPADSNIVPDDKPGSAQRPSSQDTEVPKSDVVPSPTSGGLNIYLGQPQEVAARTAELIPPPAPQTSEVDKTEDKLRDIPSLAAPFKEKALDDNIESPILGRDTGTEADDGIAMNENQEESQGWGEKTSRANTMVSDMDEAVDRGFEAEARRDLSGGRPPKSPDRGFEVGGFRSPVPTILPPVQEEAHEGAETEHRLLYRPASRTTLGSPDPTRDSGFSTGSAHPFKRSGFDEEERDSGVQLREWQDQRSPGRDGQRTPELKSHRSGRRRSRELERAKSPTDRAALLRSPFGEGETRDRPLSKTPVLREPTGRELTPEPQKYRRTVSPELERKRSKYQDLASAALAGAAISTCSSPRSSPSPGNRSVSDRVARLQSPAPTEPVVARRTMSNSSLSRHRRAMGTPTPEPLKFRPESPGIQRPGTATPPLRRADRRVSGDLRSLSQRSQLDLNKDPKDPTSSSNAPVANEGRVRTKDMADVFDGFGEGRIGSPRSPTRPHSMRRRQSMQVLELESRVEQLMAENRMLAEARSHADSHISNRASGILAERDAEIDVLKQSLEFLQKEVARLTEVNEGLNSANAQLAAQHNERYRSLETQHADTSRRLEEARAEQGHFQESLLQKDAEIGRLRSELDAAKDRIRQMQRQILATKGADSDFLNVKDVDHFDHRCQQLCSHVQQWVLRFSKFSDMRSCRLTSEINDEKVIDRLDNAILDGTDVDTYLADRVKRRDVFMSMTMNMIWEFVFTRYLFGMDREQRQKLKSLEKLLTEVGPPQAVRQWRAVTLTLLSKRPSFKHQRDLDTEAVVQAIFQTLSKVLPPPSNLEDQIQSQLRRVMREAVDLSIEMRTQRAEYMMLPPLQPEYDAEGELTDTVTFNAALMNERSADRSVTNEVLEAQNAVVRIVLFPLVVKKGDDGGNNDDEIVVCPAQVLVARPKGGKAVRLFAPGSDSGGASISGQTAAVHSDISTGTFLPEQASNRG